MDHISGRGNECALRKARYKESQGFWYRASLLRGC
jgi:hypothetical protein